jgi:hypothetical protein
MFRSHGLDLGLFCLLALLSSRFVPFQSPPAASFDLTSSNVADDSTWPLNGRMEFAFSADVDFSTVNGDTIQIADSNGVAAVGDFSLSDPHTVAFQPACPTQGGFANAGLQPGRMYTIFLPGTGQGGPTLMSTSGQPLRQNHTIHFRTLHSTDPAVLFADGAAGPPEPVIQMNPSEVDACYLEIGEDPQNRVYFEPRAVPDPELGAQTPPGFRSPLNLYSQVRSHVAFLIQLNQAIDATHAHLSTATVALEYQESPSVWKPLPHSVSLVANCTPSGAVVRLVPQGILPQAHMVRAVLEPGFADITDDALTSPVTVGSFLVRAAYDPGTMNPGDGADEVLEDFVVAGNQPGSLEDTTAFSSEPHAQWANNGDLTANFAFGGTGGPDGDFIWQIGDDSLAPPVTFTLDTTFTVITNVQQTKTENVVNGLVDVQDFIVGANGKLIIQGPNACKILVTGHATINGQIIIRGTSNPGVTSFDTTYLPEPGSPGGPGGGAGGTGNPLTSQSSPAGTPGFGAFGVAGGGGGGGETGYSSFGEDFRRGAGGGGGRLGPDVVYINPNPSPAHPCPDQSIIGLDTEPGFNGPPGGNGALHPPGTPAQGGAIGAGPFHDSDPTNDFWGTMLTQSNQFITGELAQAWAGAGGGGGGNACSTNHFPTTPWTPTGDEKGAGGGGGGGSITILSLGDIIVGRSLSGYGSGVIDASGGTGGGGENTNGNNHIGGGSGGGSGGFISLQSAGDIDFTLCSAATNPPGGLYAIGGEGGEGFLPASQVGGGGALGGLEAPPAYDALPSDAYPSHSPTTPCPMVAGVPAGAPPGTVVYTTSNTLGDTDPLHYIIGAGGDGGPGVIQLHVTSLDHIKPPFGGQPLYKMIRPPPIGADLSTINQSPVGNWNLLFPVFSRFSQSRSKWVPLGAANVDPSSTAPNQVEFHFGGTTNGLVTTYPGFGVVLDLPSILNGHVAVAPTTPYIAADLRSVVFDAGPLSDDICERNPALVRLFKLQFIHGGVGYAFDVGSANYDPVLHQLSVTASASGMPLGMFVPGDAVDLIPRFFQVTSDGVADNLPDSSQIKIEFQAAPQNAATQPDESNATRWVTDITQLNSNPNYKFIRFRVSFDLAADGQPLSNMTSVPSLEFFKIPFRF